MSDHGELTPLAVDIDSLKPFERNPNRGKVDFIAGLLDQFGAWKNIVYNRETREILAGNHTWMAAKKLGWTTIPAVGLNVNDPEAIEVLLMDNRASELSEWDSPALLALLDEPEVDAAACGWDDDALEALRAEVAAGDDFAMPEPGDAEVDGEGIVWGVVVTCRDEDEQVYLLDRFREEGLDVKALMK